jgi:hypothetical protein
MPIDWAGHEHIKGRSIWQEDRAGQRSLQGNFLV